MVTVNIAFATIHFYRLVERARAGETIIITKAGRPMGRLMPLENAEKQQSSRYGIVRRQLRSAPKDNGGRYRRGHVTL